MQKRNRKRERGEGERGEKKRKKERKERELKRETDEQGRIVKKLTTYTVKVRNFVTCK
jgi:hypothetical protein